MEYIFDKSMLTELANGGCQKQVINRLDREWKKKVDLEKKKVSVNEREYIANKLGQIPFRDTPPLAKIKKEGELAEILKIEEISYSNTIITEINIDLNNPSYADEYEEQEKNMHKYEEFIDKKTAFVTFSPKNNNKLVARIKNETINSNNFKVNLFDGEIFKKEKFKDIFCPKKCSYVYQPEFRVNNDFYLALFKNEKTLAKIKIMFKENNINFKNLRPDLIKVLSSKISCKVLNRNFEIVSSSSKKIKLQVCDIKMAEFTNKFFVELGLYMTALNAFIFKNNLDEIYEVCAVGVIFPQKTTLSPKERKENIENENLEEWTCLYSSVKNIFIELFSSSIIEIITMIEDGQKDKYNCVKINHKCQTCDYYGGQYSNHLKTVLKKEFGNKPSNEDVESYYWNNPYCRYILQKEDSINLLPCLKDGEKRLLIDNNIKNINELTEEINSFEDNLFIEHKTLKADKPMIEKNILVKNEELLSFIKISDSTLNIPSYANLNIFIDERHDTQGRSLSFSFAYKFNGELTEEFQDESSKIETSKDAPENTLKNPYISIIENYSPIIEKRYFLDFLIKLNSVLDYFQNAQSQYGKPATFAISYWNNENIKHMEKLFLGILNLINSIDNSENNDLLKEIYSDLSSKAIKEKEKDIKRVRERFNSFFTSQDQLPDYRVVEKNPFFSLKKGFEELFVFDINYHNTLIQVYNLFCNSDKKKKEIYYKPDSDHFSGTLFSRIWSEWKDITDKRSFIEKTLKSLLKDRIYAMSSIMYKVYQLKEQVKLKGTPPEIPLSSKANLYPDLKFGKELMLMHKLDNAYSLIEKEEVHNEDVYRKSVLGKAISLEYEIIGVDKEKIIKKLFGVNRNKNYKVYQLSKDSIDAKYDEGAFNLTIYPINKREYIYKKFVPKPWKNVISYNENELTNVGYINGRMYKEKVKVSIIKFDRFNCVIVLNISDEVLKIIKFLEKNEGFDFKQGLIIESTHADYWGKKLNDVLERVSKSDIAKKILEEYKPQQMNVVTSKQIEDVLRIHYNGSMIPLDISQKDAIINTVNNKLSLLWGPPGTGKSHTIAHLLLFLYLNLGDDMKRILILGNYDATDNIINNILKLIDYSDVTITRVKSSSRPNGNFIETNNVLVNELPVQKNSDEFKQAKKDITQLKNKFQVFTCTPGQIKEVFVSKSRSFMFDLVIVDEASQMNVGNFLPGLIKIKEDTQFLLAGDHLQLPPITNVKLKDSKHNYWGSIFDYYNKEFAREFSSIRRELLFNRRSNTAIVNFSKVAFDYPEEYQSSECNANIVVDFECSLSKNNFYDSILDPDKAIILLSYKDGQSHQSNKFEAEEIVNLVKQIWDKKLMDSETGKAYSIKKFFDKGIGIVVPHRAQRTRIQSLLTKCFLQNDIYKFIDEDIEDLDEKIISAVDTVEKYQGQERDIMICGYVVGDSDFISQEEGFIFNPNRLNVMISRAKAKVIIIASKEMLSYRSDDLDVLEDQQSLQDLVEYCNLESEFLDLTWQDKEGVFKYKSLKEHI